MYYNYIILSIISFFFFNASLKFCPMLIISIFVSPTNPHFPLGLPMTSSGAKLLRQFVNPFWFVYYVLHNMLIISRINESPCFCFAL